MDQSLGSDPQAPSALAAAERNRYFFGKLLDVPHLELEQNYLNGKRWLLNRLIGGSGVACGLAVVPAVNGTRLVIQPGVAIDGWGREIIVAAASLPFDPRTLTDAGGNPTGTLAGAGSVTVSICYQECGIEATPVLAASCNPQGDCAPGITLEQYCVVVQEGVAVTSPSTCGFPGLFTPPSGSSTVPDIHPALAGRVSQQCSVPSGQGCVLLAQVSLPASGEISAAMIDIGVRPIVMGQALLLELIYCLAQQVQDLAAQQGLGPIPTAAPAPTPGPTPVPTAAPVPTPTAAPAPTARPTVAPTVRPTRAPTVRPRPTGNQ